MEVGWGVSGGRGRREARGIGMEEAVGGRGMRQRRMALSEEAEKSVSPFLSLSESGIDHDSG